MDKIAKLIIFLLIVFGKTYGQHSFEISIDTDESCTLINADKDSNGNIIIVGYIGPFYSGDKDGIIIKVSNDGSYNSKRFGLADTICTFNSINVLENGNYFVMGAMNTDTSHTYKNYLWVALLDQNLNKLFQKSYQIKEPYLHFSTIFCTLINRDGDIILATSALKEDTVEKTNFADFAFYKLNQQGDTLLSQYYQYIFDEGCWDIRQMPESDNIMVIERSTHYNSHDELMFLDPDLNIIAINQFGNGDADINGVLSSNCWVSDTSFLLSGYNSWFMGTHSDKYIGVYLVDTSAVFHHELALNKIDTTDVSAWRTSMAYANDTTIYIGGFQLSPSWPWSTEPTVVELYVVDKDLNLLGYKELGGDSSYELWGVIATDDGGCLLYGTRFNNPDVYEYDVQIWKVNREDISIITQISEIQETTNEIRIYPNPFKDNLHIHLPPEILQESFKVLIYSFAGKKVFQKKFIQGGNLLSLYLNNLPQGLYNLMLTQNTNIIYTTKVIKN